MPVLVTKQTQNRVREFVVTLLLRQRHTNGQSEGGQRWLQMNSNNDKSEKSWSSRIARRPPSIVWEGIAGSANDQIWLQTSPSTSISVTNASIAVNSTSSGSMPPLRKSDSTLNSLECWDYSVELECLRGPDGKPIWEIFIHKELTIIPLCSNDIPSSL